MRTKPNSRKNSKTEKVFERSILLDNIRSVHNVGSIFRTAETIGIDKIYCCGTTPTPVDRFGRKRADFAKVALGAENVISWSYELSSESLLKSLKKSKKLITICLEQDEKSVDYKKIKINSDCLIILGNEVEGVSKKLLKLSDIIAEIPMLGQKESLNVSVAAGIFLFRIFDM